MSADNDAERVVDVVYQAMCDGDLATLNALAESGSFPLGFDEWLEHSWLTWAIQAGNPKSVAWVLDYKPDLSYIDLGSTYLMTACHRWGTAIQEGIGNPKDAKAIFELLIDAGADVNQTMLFGETLLHNAAHQAPMDVVVALVENGADVNAICHDYAGIIPAEIAKRRKRWHVHALLREAMGQTPDGRPKQG